MLPNTIEKAFERYGGQVLYRQMVDEILIQNGTAYGVRLQNGTEIHAERVIANATVWNIYGKLVRPEHIAPEAAEMGAVAGPHLSQHDPLHGGGPRGYPAGHLPLGNFY